MKKFFPVVVLVLLLSACKTDVPNILTPTAEFPTETPTEVVTDVPTEVPTNTPTATATEILPTPDSGELEVGVNKVNCPNMQCGIEDGAPTGWTMEVLSENSGNPEVYHEGRVILNGWRAKGFACNQREEPCEWYIYQIFDANNPSRVLADGGLYTMYFSGFAFSNTPQPPGGPSDPDAKTVLQACVNVNGVADINDPATVCSEPNVNMLGTIAESRKWVTNHPDTGEAGWLEDFYTAQEVYDRQQVFFVPNGGDVVVFIYAKADWYVEGQWAWPIQTVTIDEARVYALGWASDFGF